MSSKIVELMKSDSNWREIISNMGIRIKEDGDLAIFNYGIDADNSNPIVREARGIIINIKTMTVCCWPFSRFFNSYEQYADTIDWNNCRVEEKIDGSILKLWHYKIDKTPFGAWIWSTNSCIKAIEATVSNTPYTFQDLICMATNYHDIDYSTLDKNYTYIFELVSPLNQIVIKYPDTRLFHIGTRNNITGEEINTNIGIVQPRIFNIHTLDDCIEAATHLNDGNDNVEYEGFVVVDDNWHRNKIKSPAYLELHHTWNNGNVSKERIINILRTTDLPIEKICEEFPRIATQIMYYKYRMVELENNVQRYVDYVRNLYNEYNHDRKAVAMTIKNQRFASFGFEAIKPNNINATSNDLLNNMVLSKYCRWIEDYIPSNIFE